jgi:hypothetical protein
LKRLDNNSNYFFKKIPPELPKNLSLVFGI